MNVTSAPDAVSTTVALGVENDVRAAERLGPLATRANVTFDARRGRRNLWIVASVDGRESVALRGRRWRPRPGGPRYPHRLA